MIGDTTIAAKAARSAQDWRTAAILFTQAAYELPADPHGSVTASEIGLRRDAHLCLCRTPEFIKLRERRPSTVYRVDWLQPDGSLVDWLLAGHGVPHTHLRAGVAS